jgi:hypothetical protein
LLGIFLKIVSDYNYYLLVKNLFLKLILIHFSSFQK